MNAMTSLSPATQLARTRLFARRFTWAAATMLLLSGCGILPSHIHDEKAAELSTKLQTEFAAYREDQSSLYANMAANLEAFQVEEEELLSRFAANHERAVITKAVDLNGKQARERIGQTRTELEGLKSRLLAEVSLVLSDETKAELDSRGSVGAIKQLTDQIEAKKSEAEAWQARIALFQEAIAKLPDSLGRLTETANDLKGMLEGSSGTTPQTIPTEILQAIKVQLSDVPESQKKAVATEIDSAPETSLRVLQLGLDLARLKKRRAVNQLERLQVRQELIQETLAQIEIADLLLKEAASGLSRAKLEDRVLIVDDILDTKNSGVSLHEKVLSIGGRLRPLRQMTTAGWLVAYQDSVFPVRLARLKHQDSVAISEQNDQARQTIIASGLDGLAQYHSGGLTQDDIASIIGLIQSLALYLIAI